MKQCPKCGSKRFSVTANVIQDWIVDENGDFVEVEDDCVDVTHCPNDDDLWTCVECGYEGPGEDFEKKSARGRYKVVVEYHGSIEYEVTADSEENATDMIETEYDSISNEMLGANVNNHCIWVEEVK